MPGPILHDGDAGLVVIGAARIARSADPAPAMRKATLGDGAHDAPLAAPIPERASKIRVVERTELTRLAFVDRGACPQSKAEVRARPGRTIRQRIPSGKNLGCRCSGAACTFARFAAGALDEAIAEGFREGARDAIVAAFGRYDNPLASSTKGTVRAKMIRGDAEVEIDLPTGHEGDAVLRAAENSGIVTRPFVDVDRRVGTIESIRAAGDLANTMACEKIRIRAFTVAATGEREG